MHTVPAIVSGTRDDEAAARIRAYYESSTRDDQPAFSGGQFDDFLAAENPRDHFTAADLLSTGLLGVHVPGDGIVQLLTEGDRSREVNALLAQLPDDVDLSDLNDRAFARLLHRADSPGTRLWDMLRQTDTRVRIGIGPTLASKLLARKRPRLIPIWDSKVEVQLELKGSANHWQLMRQILSQNGSELVDRLTKIRQESGQEDRISILRTFDVAVWHAQKFQKWRESDPEPTLPDGDDPVVGETAEENSAP